MHVSPYSEQDAACWDDLVSRAPMATFLHSRRYLSYHADRFTDCSVLLKDADRLLAVFPAAIDSDRESRVVSHPGITYGGLLHDGTLRGQRVLEAFDLMKAHYRGLGFDSLRYKAVPTIYHLAPASDDLYALFRLGAVRYRCDLSCAIDLDHRGPVSERRRRALKKARERGVEVSEGATFAESLWQVLEENLARKFNLRPVHSVAEMRKLHSLVPDNIEFVVARLNSEVVAGVILFMTPRVIHAEYIASNEIAHEVCALDAVFEHCIKRARESAARYFSFGVSTESEWQYLNATLRQYNSEFAAGGVVHEFYEVNLT